MNDRDRFEAALREIDAGPTSKRSSGESSGIRRLRNIARAALAKYQPSEPPYPVHEPHCNDRCVHYLEGETPSLHEHRWVDARNEVVSSGELCPECGATRAAPVEPT